MYDSMGLEAEASPSPVCLPVPARRVMLVVVDDWPDLTDPLDPSNPMHSAYWGDWECLGCDADGSGDELLDGLCPHCGSEVERLG
jgi:hypothetical protein